MGGERASKTRQREAGKICAICSNPLDAPPWPGERRCQRCEDARAGGPRHLTHRIRMAFVRTDLLPPPSNFIPGRGREPGWAVTFFHADTHQPTGRRLHFTSSAKVYEAAERGHAFATLADRQAIEFGLHLGRGSILLTLTDTQFKALQ